MRRLRVVVLRLADLFQKERRERELAEEIESHLQMHADDRRRAGLSAEDARREARISLGGIEPTKESCRDRRGVPGLDVLGRDLRFGARLLRRNPAFSTIALLTLALGIGANTAIFSLVNAWILKPLPYPEPDRLVYLWGTLARHPQARTDVSGGDFEDWRAANHVFEELSAFKQYNFALNGTGDGPAHVEAQRVTANFFRMLRVQPVIGRDFLPAEDSPGNNRVTILTQEFWRSRLGSDPNVIGRALVLDGIPHTVIGVLPAGFSFPVGIRAELWVPLALTAEEKSLRAVHWLNPVARLKHGVRLMQAQRELSLIARRIERSYPQSNTGKGALLMPLADAVAQRSGSHVVLILFGVTACILLLACANVTTLLLARATQRRREVAVRMALGASRGRLIRQFVIESLLLALAASAVAVVLAFGAVRWLLVTVPAAMLDGLPNRGHADVDPRVLGFTIAVSVLAGVSLGLAPAREGFCCDPHSALKETIARTTSSLRAGRARRVLIVGEIALAMSVLSGAGLLIRSFMRLYAVDPGFRPRHLAAMTVHLPRSRYPSDAQVRGFFGDAVERIATIPGVIAVGASTQLPFAGLSSGVAFEVEGRPPSASGEGQTARWAATTPGYFATMQIPLVDGRLFDARDTPDSEHVALVNETLARRFFPNESPVDRRLNTADLPALRIVGVVADVRYWSLDDEPQAEIYQPEAQVADPRMNLVVRTIGDPLGSAAAVRARIWSIDDTQAVSALRRYGEMIDERHAQRRLATVLMALLAGVGLLLAVVGVYGVTAYSVSQRTREIGIRMALGAARHEAQALVLRQGMELVLAGMGIGLILSMATTRVIGGLLYATSPTDVGTLAGVTAVLASAALLACYWPARRASRVDPMVALRYE